MPTVLLVEDTERLALSLARGLAEEGFTVETAATGAKALERLTGRGVDAMILDLGLPDLDGVVVLEQARAHGGALPILVLTARDAVSSRVAALDAGADDYLVKPFAFSELLARLRALLRRASSPRHASLGCANVQLDVATATVHVGARTISLSPRERDLLELLLRRQDQVIGRPEILREVFGYDFDPGTNVIDVHVAHLRRKLAGAQASIETIRGTGFRLAARVNDGG